MPVKELLDYNVDVIKELVEAHTTTLVFVNTRSMTETVVQKLRLAGLQGSRVITARWTSRSGWTSSRS